MINWSIASFYTHTQCETLFEIAKIFLTISFTPHVYKFCYHSMWSIIKRQWRTFPQQIINWSIVSFHADIMLLWFLPKSEISNKFETAKIKSEDYIEIAKIFLPISCTLYAKSLLSFNEVYKYSFIVLFLCTFCYYLTRSTLWRQYDVFP